MRFPSRLKKGDTILLVSPSSPLPPEQPVEAVAAAIEKLGFRVRLGDSCRASAPRSGYAAAPAEVRAADINRGFSDRSVGAIWCTRGGSTAWQVLPLLDYACIAAHPKPFIGFSDVTSLHLAIRQRCGFITFHGPTANRTLGWKDDPFSWQSLWAALEMGECLPVENPAGEEIRILRPGHACGQLTGGNLSLVTTSLGTPWQINAKGCILYLEDVGEDVYALEEMLWQLKYNGVLDSAAGLVFGDFTNCRNNYRKEYGPAELLEDFFAGWSRPVLCNVRSAHCSPMVTLPMGAMCVIDGCGKGTVTVYR
ncbi:MAG: LD-carboxypeptidase [Oscillospiraceae bacterium]|nr:LD-carboxypeptidase [Oscillospiraceae bacterium]